MYNTFSKIFVAFLAIILLNSCLNFKAPEINNVSNAKVKNISFSGAALGFDLEVYNPNDFKIKLHKCMLNFKLEDVDFGDVSLDSVITIEGNSTINLPMTLDTEFKSLFGASTGAIMKLLQNNGKGDLKIRGYIVGKGRGLKMRYPIIAKKSIEF